MTFIQNHDVFKPFALEHVAQAYTLMMPGNTVVYFNGREFGNNRDFPKPGRGDALSVGRGSLLTRLVEARNTHGRGNYAERWDGTDGLFAFERRGSALVLLVEPRRCRIRQPHAHRRRLRAGHAAGRN